MAPTKGLEDHVTARSTEAERLGIVQLGLNTTDMPATLRLYSEAFGFANGGANAFWGEPSGIQGLGPETRGIMWWLVGRQDFFQLEVFQHTAPVPRPLHDDWRPCDHGWVRFGLLVAAFDDALEVLDRWGIAYSTAVSADGGAKRAVFRDPFVGAFVEIIEDEPVMRGVERSRDASSRPALAYATCSVGDLAAARRFYETVLGLEIRSRDSLHSVEDERLWGLAGLEPDGFLAVSGDISIEIVSYGEGVGRAQPDDHCSADLGIMNVALGSRRVALVRDVIDRARNAGIRSGTEFGQGDMLALFLLDRDKQVELIALPEDLDAAVGFSPAVPFFGTW